MSELDKIRSLVSETQARYSTAIGDLIQYSFAVKREKSELERKVEELTAALERIAGRRNCYNDINGCGASQDAKLALRGNDDE